KLAGGDLEGVEGVIAAPVAGGEAAGAGLGRDVGNGGGMAVDVDRGAAMVEARKADAEREGSCGLRGGEGEGEAIVGVDERTEHGAGAHLRMPLGHGEGADRIGADDEVGYA